jgi:predicted membrane protein
MENANNTKRGRSRVVIALVFVIAGATLFLQQMGFPFPEWLFNWQMLLILIGVIVGFSNGFRGAGWAVMILIGGIFMLDDIIPGFSFHKFAWPLIIITVGLLMLIRPHRHANWKMTDWEEKWKNKQYWRSKYQTEIPGEKSQQSYSSEDYFEATSVFGGVKKVILTKNFMGGEITCFMGGCEIDLTQADFQNRAVIDVTQIFGGTKLVVPTNWKISTQMTAVFGSIEDKRQQSVDTNADKVLVIEGTSVFGGIEIRNY